MILVCTSIEVSALMTFSGTVSAPPEGRVLSEAEDGFKRAVESGYSLSPIIGRSVSVCGDDSECTSGE